MDYVEAFENLKANEKYGRKTPHKAVLLLTVIELYESNLISSNEIRCNQLLEDTFLKVWNRTLPYEATYYTNALLPFWTMQNEGFWHLVPKRGKEEVLSFLRENQMRPSENKIRECVDYAELDEDLYFQMSLPSGRSALKRVLLEHYSTLSDVAIEDLSESKDNSEDKSIGALDEYKKMLSSDNKSPKVSVDDVVDDEVRRNFYGLDEDVQIQLNIEYYTFLKEHKFEREMFKELCPNVFDLYNKVSLNPVKCDEITSSLKFVYENFLMDLKINLLGVDGAFGLIDGIEHAISLLNGEDDSVISIISEENDPVLKEGKMGVKVASSEDDVNIGLEIRRKDLPWTENEEELLLLCYDQGRSIKDIASLLGRPQEMILQRLADLGKIENKLKQNKMESHKNEGAEATSLLDYYVENMDKQCFILNRNGERIYSTDGKFKVFHGKLYRFNYKDGICFTVKDMVRTAGIWDKGTKQIVSYSKTDLFPLLDRCNYLNQIEDLQEGTSMELNKIRVDGKWYDFDGNFVCIATGPLLDIMNEDGELANGNIVLKGKLSVISDVLNEPYDFLWLLAIVELRRKHPQTMRFSFDELACMMIAIAWCLLYEHPELRTIANDELLECIGYLMEESKENMDQELEWSTSKDIVFEEIKDYPVGGIFEDVMDELVEDAPLHVLRLWLNDDDKLDLVLHSSNYVNKCLYSLHLKKFDSYIEINPAWDNYLSKEYLGIVSYVKNKLIELLESTN